MIGENILSSHAQQVAPVISIADPKILAIPIVDNQEPMIDLLEQEEIAYGSSPEIPNNTDYTKMRASVFEKLKWAQKLLPKGLHFCLYEAFRSINLQKTLFENRMKKLKRQYPAWSSEEIYQETIKLISPVITQDGTKNIPAHSTGGAIDIYLVNDEGTPVDMGIYVKDWMDDIDGSLSATSSIKISAEARKNRNIMSEALSSVGFVNYPTEYWHWSYGERYWAYQMHKANAIYGSYDHSLFF